MRKIWLLIALPLWACAPVSPPPTPVPIPKSTLDGVFTAAQASRGATAYGQNCARCHGADLKGHDDAPSLIDGAVIQEFSGSKLGRLYDLIGTEMPFDRPASLSPATYAEITAFLLSKNRFPAGARELPGDKSSLDTIAVKVAP